MNIGYMRVSSMEQNTDRQLSEIKLDKIFREKISAGRENRPELIKCLQALRAGDTLHVHSIDRLARNLQDLQSIVCRLNQRSIIVFFHKENLKFDYQKNNITQTLMLQLMGAFAEFEKNIINERQKEGIAAAQKRGIKFGRRRSLSKDQIKLLKTELNNGESKTSLAKKFKISRQTLYNYLLCP